ncbi:hypothetical protein GUJ93_ZPchr0002g24116 [Zizania palustris]|uniref:Uncharacterized protein n=1 Tax=Zizania palustris TaxID=103762 RepID=A0A8J5ST68_ZIZPA|nr:hypothetical protein GUJ93_ZPchr0002g24116 [Zizania palustris]
MRLQPKESSNAVSVALRLPNAEKLAAACARRLPPCEESKRHTLLLLTPVGPVMHRLPCSCDRWKTQGRAHVR